MTTSNANAGCHPKLTGTPLLSSVSRLRQGARVVSFGAILLLGALEMCLLDLTSRANAPKSRALWLHRTCRRLARMLRLQTRSRGEPSPEGLFVFNHVSYLDIVTLAARHPIVFVAKKEVRSWPVIGWIAASAGTLFIDRAKRADVATVTVAMEALLRQGIRVCIFPEGTSSDGSRVLPFRTSLLEPATAHDYPVTAGWIGYSLDEGDPGSEVCYWGDLSFGPHLLNLFTKPRIFASVAYAQAERASGRRKEFGSRLHALVCELAMQRP